MAQSIANLLLRITGDEQDAENSLDRLQRELAQFARTTAEADADVDTSDAQAKLNELQRDLSEIDRERATPEVNIGIAQALGRLQTLRARLEAIDRQDIVVDAKVRQGVVNEINTLGRSVGRLHTQVGGVGREATRSSRGFRTFGLALTAALGTATAAVSRLILKLGALSIAGALATAGIGALVGSLAAAVAGLGAVGVAFGAALGAAALFGLGVKAALKAGGHAATGVKTAVTGLKGAFTDATRAGANAFLRMLAPAIRGLIPMVRSLRPAFLSFGTAAGKAVQIVSQGVSELGPEISRVIGGAGKFFKALAPAVAPFLGILLDIANAAMPFLIQGATALATKFREWRRFTSDAQGMRNVIRDARQPLQAVVRAKSRTGLMIGAQVDHRQHQPRAGEHVHGRRAPDPRFRRLGRQGRRGLRQVGGERRGTTADPGLPRPGPAAHPKPRQVRGRRREALGSLPTS